MDPRLRNQGAPSATQAQSRQPAYSINSVFPQQAQTTEQRPSSSAQRPNDPRVSQSRPQTQSGQPETSSAERQQPKPVLKQTETQRRPVVKRVSGPPKRNKQFQEQDPDCFYPRFELSYEQPDVPVGPKLFNYRLNTDQAASKYEFSCVELNQAHQILVDYNMGMRIDLVDKEKYQVNPKQQKAMLLGEAAAQSNVKVKNEEQVTDRLLEDIKQKLLSSRDKFILSNKDQLPEFDGANQKQAPRMKHASSIVSDATIKREESSAQGSRQPPVVTGQAEKRGLAIKQISETFERSREIKVGAQKYDQRGRPVKGITAVSVKDVLPMPQAELLKLSLVVNDDDLDKPTMAAGSINNGHLLHAFRDSCGDQRQSFYSLQATESIPDQVKEFIVGKKRTSAEAGFSDPDKEANSAAVQLQHVRDYAFNEIKGGMKGETADYLLYDPGTGNTMQYVPITSKLKLNKKRKASAVGGDDQMPAKSKSDISHIVMASRAYSKDESKVINDQFGKYGRAGVRVTSSMTPFEGKEDVQVADRRVADLLKEMFRHHLPKVEELDEGDAEMHEGAAQLAGSQEDEDDDGYYRSSKKKRSSDKDEQMDAADSMEEERKIAMSEDSFDENIF